MYRQTRETVQIVSLLSVIVAITLQINIHYNLYEPYTQENGAAAVEKGFPRKTDHQEKAPL
jgi:hypothetical protein